MALPTPKTNGHIEPSNSHLLHRSMRVHPPTVTRASGSKLHLEDGRVIIDACGGAAVSCIGHGNEEVAMAMYRQTLQADYIHTGAYTSSPAEELADLLVKDGQRFGLDMAYFVGSGSEAVETALKMARQFFYEKGETQRLHIVSRKGGYHGNSMAAMSVSGNVSRKIPYQGFCYPHTSQVLPPYAYRHQQPNETEAEYVERLATELDDEFQRIGPDKVIAFIGEPIIGATSGCITPPKGYWSAMRAVCDKYGILLILDEVMCGSGRCGTFFAFEPEGIVPDILTIAKGLTGGYTPLAAVMMHNKVIDVFRKGSGAFVHGHTYQAHPISCAAALTVQKIIRRERLVEQCAEMGVVLETKLRHHLKDCRSVGDIRGRGLFWAVELVTDQETKQTFDAAMNIGPEVQEEVFNRGVAVYPGHGTANGVEGDHVLLAPSYNVGEAEIEEICVALRDGILAMERIHLKAE